MPGNSDIVSTRQQQIAELAKRDPRRVLTSLNHHLDLPWLYEAYQRTRKDGAVGVDGQTAAEYEQNLEGNLRDLLERAKSGTYQAPPVRRVHIPKGTGKETRPLGIPTFEDKILQRAVAMILEPIYEQDFHDCSWGFRPQRSAHQALEVIWRETMKDDSGWVLEVDVRKYFDTLGHAQLRELLQRRVRDGVLLRLIGKWLNAGVLEEGVLTYPEAGTPQGGVISPLLANVYLHYVLDEWFEQDVRARLKGRAFLVRYADDFVIGFSDHEDAQRVMDVLPKRFGKYGLAIHPDKTRLVPFQRPPRREAGAEQDRSQGPGSFEFLGFKHYWGQSRQGNWVVKRKTAASRFTRALRKIARWCRLNRHRPIAQQHETLSKKMRGHFGYYGITGNSPSLSRFAYEVRRTWRRWLARRNRERRMPWPRFNCILERYRLPPAVAVHSVYRGVANP